MTNTLNDNNPPEKNNYRNELFRFCTPDRIAKTESDTKALAGATSFEIPFEGQILKGYRWGSGKTVLLIHGWSSRASHMALIGRALAKSGFCAIAIDGPAHGESTLPAHGISSMPEFCRAIYHVANQIGPLYGLIGHSFGGAACAYTVAGLANMAGYAVCVEKLVLISPPPDIMNMIDHYCRKNGFSKGAVERIKRLLENEYPIKVTDYGLLHALKRIDSDVLIVHDSDDEEVDISETINIITQNPQAGFIKTRGEGHQRILVSRTLLRSIKDFF